MSDAYEQWEEEPQLEVCVQVLNINGSYNLELKKRCRTLQEYMQYVELVRHYTADMRIEEAVQRAVDECIGKGILADFLLENKSEVVAMSIFEYDEEANLKAVHEHGFEYGLEQGMAQGIEQGIEQGEDILARLVMKLLADNRTEDVLKATQDKSYREALYREYQI